MIHEYDVPWLQVLPELVETCRSHGVTDIVMVHEHRGEPDGLVISHLPYGPTAYFGLYNVVRGARHCLHVQVSRLASASDYGCCAVKRSSIPPCRRICSVPLTICPVERWLAGLVPPSAGI